VPCETTPAAGLPIHAESQGLWQHGKRSMLSRHELPTQKCTCTLTAVPACACIPCSAALRLHPSRQCTSSNRCRVGLGHQH